jgi:drug/metabolite transporter (DMT)-like permease
MDLLKLATEWAKAEAFSARFFIFFAILFLIASVGFWQLGKTDLAKAYIIPTVVAGLLLITIGIGLFFTNKSRITQFEQAFNANAPAFFQSEIKRSESTLKEYTVVLKVVPILIIIAALIVLFIHTPTWRAISITTIAMLIIILFVDGTAHARIEAYHKELKLVEIENETNK